MTRKWRADQKRTHTGIWVCTLAKLKELATLRNKSMVATIDWLVNRELGIKEEGS